MCGLADVRMCELLMCGLAAEFYDELPFNIRTFAHWLIRTLKKLPQAAFSIFNLHRCRITSADNDSILHTY